MMNRPMDVYGLLDSARDVIREYAPGHTYLLSMLDGALLPPPPDVHSCVSRMIHWHSVETDPPRINERVMCAWDPQSVDIAWRRGDTTWDCADGVQPIPPRWWAELPNTPDENWRDENTTVTALNMMLYSFFRLDSMPEICQCQAVVAAHQALGIAPNWAAGECPFYACMCGCAQCKQRRGAAAGKESD